MERGATLVAPPLATVRLAKLTGKQPTKPPLIRRIQPIMADWNSTDALKPSDKPNGYAEKSAANPNNGTLRDSAANKGTTRQWMEQER